jgi:hypothetical protein
MISPNIYRYTALLILRVLIDLGLTESSVTVAPSWQKTSLTTLRAK